MGLFEFPGGNFADAAACGVTNITHTITNCFNNDRRFRLIHYITIILILDSLLSYRSD